MFKRDLLINTCLRSHIENDYVLTDLLYTKQHLKDMAWY
jgi:hypothetical protein